MLRPTITELPASRIREVANAGIGRTDVLKFWFGECDQVTPAFIRAEYRRRHPAPRRAGPGATRRGAHA